MKPARESDAPSSGPLSGPRASLADMRLADAITVLAVERLGSMSKAARELGVTPSQVSKTISRLQSWMGGSLFAREGSELRPTALGRRFLERMRPLVDALRDLSGDVELKGAVRVQASELAFLLCVGPLTQATGGRFVLDVSGAQPDSSGDADITLRLGDAPPSGARVLTLGAVSWGLFAAPATAERLAGLATESELSAAVVPIADPESDVAYGEVLRALLPCTYRFGTRVPAHAALDVVAASDQVVAFPVANASHHVAAGRLVEIASPEVRPETPIVGLAHDAEWDALLLDVKAIMTSLS